MAAPEHENIAKIKNLIWFLFKQFDSFIYCRKNKELMNWSISKYLIAVNLFDKSTCFV